MPCLLRCKVNPTPRLARFPRFRNPTFSGTGDSGGQGGPRANLRASAKDRAVPQIFLCTLSQVFAQSAPVLFAADFAGPCVPMGSNAVAKCQRRTMRMTLHSAAFSDYESAALTT
jgi:hypothetical protein